MKKLFLLLINLLFVSFSFAQNTTILGKIISNEDNSPIAGASLTIKGTVSGTVANVKGTIILITDNFTQNSSILSKRKRCKKEIDKNSKKFFHGIIEILSRK